MKNSKNYEWTLTWQKIVGGALTVLAFFLATIALGSDFATVESTQTSLIMISIAIVVGFIGIKIMEIEDDRAARRQIRAERHAAVESIYREKDAEYEARAKSLFEEGSYGLKATEKTL